MMIFLVFLLFVTLAICSTPVEKKKEPLSERERYNGMVDYLSKFSGAKEARPMVNKIKNSEEWQKLHSKFGATILQKEKKK